VLRHTHRTILLAVLAVLAAVCWLFVPDGWFQVGADDLVVVRATARGLTIALGLGFADSVGVELRRRNPAIPAIPDDVREGES